MDFLDRFNERDRDRLLSAATTVRLARGEHLIRRGERGGDVYRLAEGELEVIDSRTQPAVVLDVISRGAMVGEMGFLEDQVRTADVRAAENSVCQRWDRHVLLRVLDADPVFAAGFYRALAGLAVDRARSITTTAMSGALGPGRGRGGAASGAALEQARVLVAGVRQRLLEIEPVLRRDRALARRELLAALHSFTEAVAGAFARMSDDDVHAAGEAVARELHPYVMRSHLGEVAIDRVEGHCGDTWSIAHVLADRPKGDGPLGEVLDEWLLGLPTSRALRERAALAGTLVAESLPATPPFRILAVPATAGCVLREQLAHLGRVGGEVVCVDGSRDALSCADSDLSARPRNVKVRLVQDDLAQLALGRPRIRHQPQHVLVIDGLLEYLPERVAVGLLRWARDLLAPGGHIVITGMLPAPDDAIFRFLLQWPMNRRSRAATEGLLAGAGFPDARVYEAGSAGIVAVAAGT